MYRVGLLEGNFEKPKAICANPPCTNSRWTDDQGNNTTPICVRCESASYCSKQCQTKYWKGGHKKECRIIAAARKEWLAAKHPKSDETTRGQWSTNW
mmetsp:Transcript_28002/g.50694  ORF Transcript_28002/g.50694 Transcript_28002/m.50694 type:complete len:97 (-) Transcript_28002:588-878(-)